MLSAAASAVGLVVGAAGLGAAGLGVAGLEVLGVTSEGVVSVVSVESGVAGSGSGASSVFFSLKYYPF